MAKQRWLLLLHQIPPKPAYFRAKVLRRLAQAGALPIKNSAYVLPDSVETLEDLAWLCREIEQQGGAAWLWRAEALAGMSSRQIKDGFRSLHDAEYESLLQQGDALLQEPGLSAAESASVYRRLIRRSQELERIDFFAAPLQGKLDSLLGKIGKRLKTEEARDALSAFDPGRVWVTRRGVKVDRICSAWLIRRFIDPQATFRFVDPDNYEHRAEELRFDMFEGEFTHEGDACTFEVLVSRHHLTADSALAALAEMVHDIDLKEERYGRPETAGLARLIDGLCRKTAVDETRIEQGSAILESLYRGFS